MRVFNRLGIVPTLLILSDIGLAASPSGQAYSASEGSIRTPTTDSTAQVDVDGVRLFADNLGITVDEAIIRLDREPAISELQRSAQSLYGATYAGLWVDHSDAGIVNIASTRYDFDIVNRLSSEFPDPELLEFTIARYSLGQLELIQDDVMAVANQPSALGFPAVSSDLDYESNSVVLFPKRPLTDSQLGELSLLYGDAVTVDQGTHFETNSSALVASTVHPRSAVELR